MSKRVMMCQTCANQVHGDWCTRALPMFEQSRKYKKCHGYKQYVAPLKKVEVVKVEKPTDYEALGSFGKFLKTGGHLSLNIKVMETKE